MAGLGSLSHPGRRRKSPWKQSFPRLLPRHCGGVDNSFLQQIDSTLKCAYAGPDMLIFTKCRSLLFAKNFQKHLEAADMVMAELSASGEGEAVLSCLDLLLRWAVIRLCDPRGNTTSLLKVLDMCKALLEFLDARDEQLSQIEAACLFPCIVEKAGHNNVCTLPVKAYLLHHPAFMLCTTCLFGQMRVYLC